LALIGLPLAARAGADVHAGLMVCGFLGTVIALERAVAVATPLAYAAPALSAAGAALAAAGALSPALAAWCCAGAVLAAVSLRLALRHPAAFTFLLALGALAWSLGSLLALGGWPMPHVAGLWLSFLVLTIAAERLELSRLAAPPVASQIAFAAALLFVPLGALRGELGAPSAPLMAAGLIASVAWLLVNDIARRTLRRGGVASFSAAAILIGHVWLGVAGLLLLAPQGPLGYDAAVHAIAIGFVLSMIFGHAPIVLPAVTGLVVTFTPAAYGPLAVLQLSVMMRMAGDLLTSPGLRSASALATVLALASYAATLAMASLRTRRV
jgi:hypothetical protein